MPDIFTDIHTPFVAKADAVIAPQSVPKQDFASAQDSAAAQPSVAQPSSTLFTKLHTTENITFHKQDPDEKIILLLRKHFITNVSWIITTVFFSLLPLFMGIIFSIFSFSAPPVPIQFIPVLLATYYLLVTLYAITHFISWLYNVFIVTQKRIVDVDFSDVIYHDVAITKIEEVEDVHYTQSGFLSSIFNYGNLFVQTQADKANFEALGVPQPAEAAHILIELTGHAGKGGKDD
jgi:hypothetical protein